MKKKLHILFLCNWLPSRISEINGDFIMRHAEVVATRHKVSAIFITTDKNSKSKIEIDNFTKNNVNIVIGYVSEFKNPILKLYYFLKAYNKCLEKIDEYDIIHLNVTSIKGIVTLFAKWFRNKPFIISEHWTRYLYPNNLSITIFDKFIIKTIIKNASFICPVSNELKNHMISYGLEGNYSIIPNVIDTNLFFPKKKNIEKFTISHISALRNKQKNILGILKVIKELSLIRNDFIFKLIGNSDSTETETFIEKLQIPSENIELLGAKNHEKIPSILQQSNLYISFSNYETFGIVMAEAIACGTPVISTNTGILSELDLSEYCSIIPIGNQQLLLEQIQNYMNNPKTYNLTKMNHSIKSLFCVEKVCEDFTKLYLKTLKL